MKRYGLKMMILLMSFILLGCSTEVYTVSFNSMGGTEVDDVMVEENDTISMPDSSKEGLTLDGWYTSLDEGDTLDEQWVFTEDKVSSDMTLYAKWSPAVYTVTFNSNGGTNVESVTVAYEESIDQPTNPTREGYRFTGWYSGFLASTLYDFSSPVNRDITLIARWEETDPNHIDIGVILPDASEERWARLDGQFFMEELDALGYNYEILFSDGNEAKEITNAEVLIARGASVIILTSEGSGAGVADLVAAEEGVTLIAHDRMARSNTASADFYTTFNFWEVGKAQGQHLVDMAIDNGCSITEPCDLALFSGRVANWPASTYFFGGAMEIIIPELDMFNIINVNKTPFENIAEYFDTYGVITETNFDDYAKNTLQYAMASVDTDWNPYTAQILASALVNEIDTASMSDDAYILCPADFLSPVIQAEFMNMDTPYNRLYVTGQDAMDTAIASLMGDPINGEGTQTMTVFKDVSKLVASSVKLAKNIIDGVPWDTGLETGPSLSGVNTVYAPIDVLLASYPQRTYDLIFATGYKDENRPIFANIDFSIYKDEE